MTPKLTPPQERLLRELAYGCLAVSRRNLPGKRLAELGFATRDRWQRLVITDAGRAWLKEKDGK